MTLQHTADHRGRHGTEHRAGQQGESSQHRAGGEDRDRHDEQGLRGELAHHERRAGDRHRQQQQVAGGQPLHDRCADREFLHQCGLGDVQRRFRQDAEERQDGQRHHDDDEFRGDRLFAAVGQACG